MAHSEATSGDGGALKGPSLTSAGCAVPIPTSCASDRRVAGEERALAGRGDGTRRVLCFACGDGDRCSVPELVCICALTVRAIPVNPLRLTRSNRPVKAGPLAWRGLGHRASALRASSERRSERLRTQRGARGQREGASEARVEGEKEGSATASLRLMLLVHVSSTPYHRRKACDARGWKEPPHHSHTGGRQSSELFTARSLLKLCGLVDSPAHDPFTAGPQCRRLPAPHLLSVCSRPLVPHPRSVRRRPPMPHRLSVRSQPSVPHPSPVGSPGRSR